MFPPIFTTCSASPVVTAVLGSSPTRIYPFGEAPQNVAKPYAVWQTLSGSPENYLGRLPDIDLYIMQIDVYAATVTLAREAAEAIRDAVEPVAHVTSWNGEFRDSETNNYRVSFTVDWWVERDFLIQLVDSSGVYLAESGGDLLGVEA
jgi:hypothetical protein